MTIVYSFKNSDGQVLEIKKVPVDKKKNRYHILIDGKKVGWASTLNKAKQRMKDIQRENRHFTYVKGKSRVLVYEGE